MKIRTVIQSGTAALIFLTGLVFGFLQLFGVSLTVNESDINGIIFGLATVIAALIEFIPLLISLIKDGNFRELLSIVNDVVYAVEESKNLSGSEKKTKALISIRKICYERNIHFDEKIVSDMIESILHVYNTVVKS